jgi:hypothetical protein
LGREQLQTALDKASELASEREKLVAALRQQVEREGKANASKTDLLQREIEQLQAKVRSLQSEATKQSLKTREALEES